MSCLTCFADVAALQPLLADRPLLVLVNPFSGRGTALQAFQRHVVPMFAEAALHYQLVVTGLSTLLSAFNVLANCRDFALENMCLADAGKYFFCTRIIHTWNSMTESVISASSLVLK